MQSILIDSLFTTSAPSPSNSRDQITQAACSLWESGDEAGFSITAPSNYVTGSNLRLEIHESSASPSMSHSWTVTAILSKEVNGQTVTHTDSSTHRFVSPATPGYRSNRIMIVTGSPTPGTINNQAILPGDFLSFIIRRSNPSSGDDPLEIRVFSISLLYEATTPEIYPCAGRVGIIAKNVRDLFNEPNADYLTDDFILNAINRCQQDIASEGYWQKSAWIPTVKGQDEIDLMSVIPDYVDVYQITWGPQRLRMTPLTSLKQFLRLRAILSVPGTPEYFLVQSGRLMILPAPSMVLSEGLLVQFSYSPPSLTCSEHNPNPDLPPSHDQLFVYFALSQAFLKDRAAPGADVKFHEYHGLYQNLKKRLIANADPMNPAIRPLR